MTIDARAAPEREKLAFIDGLRGLAILMVLACHVVDHKLRPLPGYGEPALWEHLKKGRYGVALFFAVSAFSLYHSSRSRFLTSPRPYLDFYLRRALRILPAWWLACAAYQLWTHGAFPLWWGDYSMGFGFFRDRHIIFDGDWSIFVEALFYAVVPLLLLCVRGLGGSAAFLVAACVAAAATTGLGADALEPSRWNRTAVGLVAYGPCFAVGVVAYFAWEGRARIRLGTRVRIGLECGTWALLVWVFGAPSGLLPAAFGLLLLLCSSERTVGGRIARLKWLGLFGRCSYSIYLFHLIVLDAVGPWMGLYYRALGFERLELVRGFLWGFPAVAALCLLVGLAGQRAVEAPPQRLGRQLLARLPAERRGSAPAA